MTGCTPTTTVPLTRSWLRDLLVGRRELIERRRHGLEVCSAAGRQASHVHDARTA
jgi:hypothetical protein